ncbi:MAG: indolepyruvate ferredoxin oxidoreductase subunit alpha [Firmicutes bacterium]|nr:indolepyruvate ferredoxin oxidoreductase subunit alpha [Bacillota bacterium]
MKKIMTGNEAIAYGAYMNGVRVGSAYPGTPSTEILESFAGYPHVFAEWAPNEKVALDVGIGAAYAGTRAMVAMKHVGVNVAADSLFYVVYTGLKGGLVIVTADDPNMHSSQNEQDNRNYAKFAKLPMLEPSDSEEAKQFVGLALEMSEKFDTPVMLRSVTRLSHSSSPVEVSKEGPPLPPEDLPLYERNIQKYVMVPANARLRHPLIEARLKKLAEYAETLPVNRIEPGDDTLGIIAAGAAYQYAREVFPEATFLKLGMVYPLPEKMIRKFAAGVEKILVVEELDPFFEEQIRLMGIEVRGKDVFPVIGELTPNLIRKYTAKAGLLGENSYKNKVAATDSNPDILPIRPPMLCPGCGHRGLFHVLREADVVVFGDIGCYALGAAPPLSAVHTCGCMGASVGVAHGVSKAGVQDRIVAVIGDSTFFHAGIHPLINTLYNGSSVTTIITDNSITAMTGHQQHPGTGITLQKQQTKAVNLEQLVRGIGFEKIDTCDPYDLDNLSQVLEDHLASEQPSVIIAKRSCVLYTREKDEPPQVDPEECTDCGTCLELGCSPLLQEEGYVRIDPLLCNGCGLCIQVCPVGAITRE